MPQLESQPQNYEANLLRQAMAYRPDVQPCEVTEALLREVASERGIDFATTWLYQRIRWSTAQQEFIHWIDSTNPNPAPLSDWDVTLAIVPGAFYQEFPSSGADGRMVQVAARELGIEVQTVPTNSFGRLEQNAGIICRWLLEQPPRPVILVSPCKGAADIRLALSQPEANAAFCNVRGWVSLSGIVFGTPMADWVLSKPLWKLWYRCLLKFKGYDFAVLQQLSRQQGPLTSDDVRVPDHICCLQVVGFPLQHQATKPLASRCHRRTASHGPNDGGGILLADVCRLPGPVYPLWGADHYLRPPACDTTRLIRQLLLWIMEHGSSHGSSTKAEGILL